MTASETSRVLATDAKTGISESEAKRRMRAFGANVIEDAKGISGVLILLNQFRSPLILILALAGAVTIAIAHYRDAFFILLAVAVNVILGFYQEYKAEQALAELKTYLRPRVRLMREGHEADREAAMLVPGDVIRLSQGDRAPADGRIVFANDLQMDEAILTGESLPAIKTANPVAVRAVLGDQRSMIFAGTLVSQGVATVIVCRTDLSTELGKIAALVSKSRREETPLQGAIRRFSLKLGFFICLFTSGVFLIGIFSGYSWLEMFLTSVAIAVPAVPEGLPVAMTVILATGVQRMARRKGVVRKLVAAEALGSATVILTDKTGTLTTANMEVSRILPFGKMTEEVLLGSAILNTTVLVENPDDPAAKWRMSGRAIEAALVRSAGTRGIFAGDVKQEAAVTGFLPFNAANKFSVSLIRRGQANDFVFFGAPDLFIRHSSLDKKARAEILRSIDRFARSGELVLGIATRTAGAHEKGDLSKSLASGRVTFEGIVTLRDPVRPGVRDAIRRVEQAGIKTLILTGDHRGTAVAVAKDVGLPAKRENVLDFSELQGLSEAELKRRLPQVRVISRVSPSDKMRIVQAFQQAGEVVAMTGDGVNDAPSIQQADVGIAMGSGSDVARDVADLVLLDDNFETIAAAVQEGRQIRDNIRKVLVYLLSGVMDELFLIGGSLAAGIALPLNALQILWVNFFSDSFPAVAFAFERGAGVSPLPVKKGGKDALFDPLTRFLVLFIGISSSASLFFLYWILLLAGFSPEIVRTFIFASFGTYSLFLAFSVRSLEQSLFSYHLFSNRPLAYGVGIGVVLTAAAVYLPPLQSLFGTVPLPLPWVIGVLGVGAANVAFIEIGKWIFRIKYKLSR